MAQLRAALASTGAAVLLVLIAFTAGAATAPAGPARAALDVKVGVRDLDDRPSHGEIADDDVTTAVPTLGQAELVYVPITPCRIVDSRAGTGSYGIELGDGSGRSYYVAGTTGFPTQGGRSGGCSIPTSAMAVSATVLAYRPSSDGRIVAWAAAGAEPAANVMYYGASSLGVGVTLPLTNGAGKDLKVRNVGSSTDLIIDVTGYYVPQMWAVISGNGTVLDQSGRVVAVERIRTGWYWVTWDRDIAACVGVGSARTWLERRVVVYPSDSNGSYVDVYDGAGNAVDDTFSLAILC